MAVSLLDPAGVRPRTLSWPPQAVRHAPAGFLILYFFAAGLLLVPYPGIEDDEALFAGAIYMPEGMEAKVRLFGRPVATMIMSYLGTLKAWLYAPIFAVFGPSVYTLRLPALAVGAGSLWLFYRLLDRVHGRRAAILGALLLATDVSFLLTACLDWGPVVLQHLLLLGGMLLLLRFHQGAGEISLKAAFFLFGLALWDKALFSWMLGGLAVAAALALTAQIRSTVTWRRCGAAAKALLLGALPLVAYNLATGFATFRNRHYSLEDWQQKVSVLRYTIQGNAMKAFLVGAPAAGPAGTPNRAVEAASVRLSELLGHPETSWLPWVLIAAVAMAPLAWTTRARKSMLFFGVAAVVTWLQMLVTVNAGASVHHTILVWPLLVGFIAVTLAGAVERASKRAVTVVFAGVVLAAGWNAALLNEYLSGLIRFGPAPMWTDAVYPLAEALKEHRPGVIYAADWGMSNSVRMLLEGKTPLGNAVDPISRQELDAAERARVLERVAQPGAVFVAFVDGRGYFPAAKRLLLQSAEAAGFRRKLLATVPDRRGRPVFELFRFQATAPE